MEQQDTTSQQQDSSHITLKSILGGDILITYNLNIDGQNYEDYYSTLKRLKKMIIDKDCNKSKKYIDDFKIYIKNFEELKDDKYYFIEISHLRSLC